MTEADMKASILDLRRKMREILRALDRSEPVTILYRGKKRGVLFPADGRKSGRRKPVSAHPAFGMWKRRADMRNVKKAVRALRKGRFNAV
jgi:hypothetical protein